VPVPHGLSALKGGSAVSVRVVTTMFLARAGGAKPPKARQQAVIKIVIKLTVTLCVCILVLLMREV
jgi:hypothetical protein